MSDAIFLIFQQFFFADSPRDKLSRLSPNSQLGRSSKATKFLRTASKSTRFQATFVAVLKFICKFKTLTFVLEDVELADSESLELLKAIAQSRTLLTVIFTCRTEELSYGTQKLLSTKIANVTTIKLHPLTEQDTSKIVSETLHRSEEYCFPLAAVALEKTAGNPFYLKTWLEDCYRKNCIWYSWSDKAWKYDLDEIFKHFASADVQIRSEFILERLLELPGPARSFLCFATFLGNRFRFSVVKLLMQSKDRPIDPQKKEKLGKLHPDFPRASSQDAVRGLEVLLSGSILMTTEDDDSKLILALMKGFHTLRTPLTMI